jgi:hypothetical protein
MAKSIPVGTSVTLSAYGDTIDDNWVIKRYAIRGTVISHNSIGQHTVMWELPSHPNPSYRNFPVQHSRRHLKAVKG